MAKKEIYENHVKKHLIKKFGKTIKFTKSHRIKLNISIPYLEYIDASWYDYLVLDRHYRKKYGNEVKNIHSSMPGVHLIEVKYTSKGKIGSFGAFTLGEWISAYLFVQKRVSFDYTILYVIKKGRGFDIHEIEINKNMLEDLVSSTQIKLYFRTPLIYKYIKNRRIRKPKIRVDQTRNPFLRNIYQLVNKNTKRKLERKSKRKKKKKKATKPKRTKKRKKGKARSRKGKKKR